MKKILFLMILSFAILGNASKVKNDSKLRNKNTKKIPKTNKSKLGKTELINQSKKIKINYENSIRRPEIKEIFVESSNFNFLFLIKILKVLNLRLELLTKKKLCAIKTQC